MISTLTGSSTSEIKNRWKNSDPYVTGYDIYCEGVYNVAYGQVVFIGTEPDGTFTVNVKCNANEVLRYGNVVSLNVKVCQYVKKGEKIGSVKEYVHFEYATRWRAFSKFTLRINAYTFYKQDPTSILEGTYSVYEETPLEKRATKGVPKVTYAEGDQSAEFTGETND